MTTEMVLGNTKLGDTTLLYEMYIDVEISMTRLNSEFVLLVNIWLVFVVAIVYFWFIFHSFSTH